MKFDCIIMNPPYDRNLHLKILAEAIKHLNDDDESVCVNLSPSRWISDPLGALKKNSDFNRFRESVSKHIEDLHEIEIADAQAMFDARFWTKLGIYRCDRKEHSLYENVAKRNNKAWSLVEKIGIPLFLGNLGVRRVFDEFSKNVNYPHWVKCSRVHGHQGKKDEFDCITPKIELVLDKKGHEGKEVYFKSEEEAINFFKMMNLQFFKFLKSLKCYPLDDFNKGLPWMGDSINPRTRKKGYESEWTDEDFYQFFNITEDEKKVIEETMKKYS